eukprot:CAMPEP_0173123712 /NCGR_PEP_ID=MMETSP1102-20130122/55186_1 /TAXON_ID=49646 /ORGANISM="Geminigera sp., Strain Caron Lab Isolate" /LENGTH=188 /DNA_ID=CAMNT_0014031845 /DNA_START=477 /DNA_END=1044 /DNA_ORIENTATION=+
MAWCQLGDSAAEDWPCGSSRTGSINVIGMTMREDAATGDDRVLDVDYCTPDIAGEKDARIALGFNMANVDEELGWYSSPTCLSTPGLHGPSRHPLAGSRGGKGSTHSHTVLEQHVTSPVPTGLLAPHAGNPEDVRSIAMSTLLPVQSAILHTEPLRGMPTAPVYEPEDVPGALSTAALSTAHPQNINT